VSTIRQRYSQLSADRSPYLTRARDCSRYTVPSLIPPAGSSGGTKLKVTYSSHGARVVNSLSAKLALALLPAGAPFFRYSLDAVARKGVEAQGPEAYGEVELALQKMEATAQEEIELSAARASVRAIARHLIIGGNCAYFVKPDNGIKVFSLPQYVAKRDPSGALMELIIEERISEMEVPEDLRAAVTAKAKTSGRSSQPGTDTYVLHTRIWRTDQEWKVIQELEDIEVPDSAGSYPLDFCPWGALRWTSVDGEDYGRSHVEDYLGDLISIEGLAAAIVKAAAVSAKVVYLCNPTGVTKPKDVTSANSGDVIKGRLEDIEALQAQKQIDMQVAMTTLDNLKRDVAFAFLSNTAIQRDAERVTAEEIRFMAQELDSELGGIYTVLSVEFQLPYVRRLTHQLQKQNKLPALPQKAIRPLITTGVEAIGRGAELENLRAFVRDIVELGGPQALDTELDFGELSKRLATARRIKVDGLVLTAEQKQQRQQQRQMQSMVENLGPNAVNQAGALVKQGMANQQGVSQ